MPYRNCDPIYAVVWSDFGVPLNLKYPTAAEAIAKAEAMYERATRANFGDRLNLRAVELTPANQLITLWAAPAASTLS